MITVKLFGVNFGSADKQDKTEGTVRASVEARMKVENAADDLRRVIDRLDDRASITIRGFMQTTRELRRD